MSTATPMEDAAVWRALADRWQRFAMVLHHHLAHVRSAVPPLAQQHLSSAGWRTAEDAAKSAHGPRELVFLVPWPQRARTRSRGTGLSPSAGCAPGCSTG